MSRAAIMMLALAVFPLAAAAEGDPARGQAKSTACAACHGADGNSASGAFPRLAGQYEEYLYQALTDYKAGRRKNPIMAAQVANLSPDDMRDLAAWFSSRRGLEFKR